MVSGQLPAPAALATTNEPQVSTGNQAGRGGDRASLDAIEKGKLA
jgi:hypothetical protein